MDPAASTTDPRSPRHCYKCGREIGPDQSICEICNRAGMATPSASQYHGTMAVAIIAGVVGLAIWASLAMRGVGPYQASVVGFVPAAGDAVTVTVQVANQGTARGTPTCRLEAQDAEHRPIRSAGLATAQIDGGQTATFSGRIPGLPQTPAEVTVSCR
jgi:predicted nucleic acid-binding Zn ribbon protein